MAVLSLKTALALSTKSGELYYSATLIGAPLLYYARRPLVPFASKDMWQSFGWAASILIASFLLADGLRNWRQNPEPFPFYRVFIELWLWGLVFSFFWPAMVPGGF